VPLSSVSNPSVILMAAPLSEVLMIFPVFALLLSFMVTMDL